MSALLDRVRHGETILIIDRNRPVARLEPVISGEGTDPEGRLLRLERAGILRRRRVGPVARILEAPPRPRRGGDVLKALLEEREAGR